jgi:intracellular septation protein
MEDMAKFDLKKAYSNRAHPQECIPISQTCVKLTTMNSLIELFPVLIFVGAYYLVDIFTATALAIAASVVQVIAYRLRQGQFKKSHLVTLLLISVFGGLTLFLQDEDFIKWKFTVVSCLFGLVIYGSQFIGKKTIIERMMGSTMSLPRFVWLRANSAMAALMMLEGLVNIYVLYNFDTETWFNIKFYGMTAVTLLFMLGLGFYLARYMEDRSSNAANENANHRPTTHNKNNEEQ